MAKPYENQPGCSGHLHFSLKNIKGENLFLDEKDPQFVSATLKSFVAGVMQGLPSIMAILAPTINSYKRLNAAYWAPVTISYGFESRTSAIRIITPPICSSNSTRIEVRVPGADHNPYLAIAAILACGYRGITQNLPLPAYQDPSSCPSLPRSLLDAVEKMDEPNSIARQVLGAEFIDHYVATRRHELRLWQTTVTTWELNRYMETV
jgi:glutamine synthetase